MTFRFTLTKDEGRRLAGALHQGRRISPAAKTVLSSMRSS